MRYLECAVEVNAVPKIRPTISYRATPRGHHQNIRYRNLAIYIVNCPVERSLLSIEVCCSV